MNKAITQTGLTSWFSVLLAMSRKELTVMLRYPVEFIASFGQIFLIVAVFTLAGLMFAPGGTQAMGRAPSTISGLVVSGLILFLFVSNTLWTIGYNLRHEQKQGTLEQLYLSPASKFASLLSRVTVTLVWTGLLSFSAAAVMSSIIGQLPFDNWPLALALLALSLSGTFGVGFAFAAITLRIRETAQTVANLLQFAYMIVCAPFFPFSTLPVQLQAVSRLVPLSYSVDAFRTTLMGFPPGYPELAPLNTEIVIVAVFGVVMPLVGYWMYRREEDRARRDGSLSEY